MVLFFFLVFCDVVWGLVDVGQVCVFVIFLMGKYFSVGMVLDIFGGDGVMLDIFILCVWLNFQFLLCVLMDCFMVLDEVCFLIFCVIQGGCIGGVFDLVVVCDICYVSVDVFFCVQEINIGMVVDFGVLQCL